MIKKLILLFALLFSLRLFADDDELTALFDQATHFYKAREYEKAIKCFKQAQQHSPVGIKSNIINYNLATCFLNSKNYEQASALFQQVQNSKERLPAYLVNRNTYNLLVAKLNLIQDTLEQPEPKLDALLSAQQELSMAEKIKDQLLNQKDFLSKGAQEGFSLYFKDLRSSLSEKLKCAQLDSYNCSAALEKIKSHLISQALFCVRLNEKKLEESATRYFFNRQFVQSSQLKPLWERFQVLVKDELQKEEVSFNVDANIISKQVRESFHEYLTALDAMKESLSWQAHLRSDKSKFLMDLVELELNNKDVVSFCLKKRLELFNRKQKAQAPLADVLKRELAFVNQTCFNQWESFLQLDKAKIKNSQCELAGKLKQRLKLSHYQKDFIIDQNLFAFVESDLIQVLYPLYQKIFEKNIDLDKEALSSQAQLEAANIFLNIEKNDPGTEIARSASRANESILAATSALRNKDTHCAQNNLEDAFTHYGFAKFMSLNLQQLSEMISPIKQMYPSNEKLIKTFKRYLDHTKTFCKQLAPSTENFELQKQLLQLLDKISIAYALKDELSLLEHKKLLLENVALWLERSKSLFHQDQLELTQCVEKMIREERLALGFSKMYPQVDLDQLTSDELLLEMTVESQDYPLLMAHAFEKAMNDSNVKKDAIENMEFSLTHFQKGLECAKQAKDALNSQAIDWKYVSNNQQLAIENWEKIFENSSCQNPSKQASHKNSSQQKDSDSQDNSTAQSDQSEFSNESQEGEHNSYESIMGLLEQLNEMELDDKLQEPPKPIVKEGLRPW